MKRQLVPILLAAALSGCAVVAPYDRAYGTYSSAPVYSQPYQASPPGYVVPAPVYRPPIYAGPPVRFGFGLNYWSGGGHHHGHHGGPHHGHHHGFRGQGFHGGRGGWRH
jgi:hypothetical protein